MNIIDNKRVATLRVPGASLYYAMRGSGPVLLMIAGGGGNADSFDSFADHLADQYTIVTYDRREYFPYRCAVALAGRLETAVVEFPGNHAGFVNHPREFAQRLRDVLGD